MAVVVSDTSPVRSLSHLDCLSLLRDLFGQVVIPPAVEQELRTPPASFKSVDLRKHGFVRIQAPRDRKRVESFLESLDAGEAEALALAEEIKASAVLIDEAAGRASAVQNGLPVIGTLGILLRAKERGLIDAIRPLLDSLQKDLGFFIGASLRDFILQQAGE